MQRWRDVRMDPYTPQKNPMYPQCWKTTLLHFIAWLTGSSSQLVSRQSEKVIHRVQKDTERCWQFPDLQRLAQGWNLLPAGIYRWSGAVVLHSPGGLLKNLSSIKEAGHNRKVLTCFRRDKFSLQLLWLWSLSGLFLAFQPLQKQQMKQKISSK